MRRRFDADQAGSRHFPPPPFIPGPAKRYATLAEPVQPKYPDPRRVSFKTGEASGMHKLAVRFGHTASLTQRSAHADISAATLSVFQWIEAQTTGPFSGAAVQAAFPAAPFAVLKDVLSLCVRAQFLKLLRFPSLGTPG
jgi:hypothetical protein